MVVGCILAGGVGRRVGAQEPKQFYKVFGKPIIVYTMERFNNCPDVDIFDVVCVTSYIDEVNKLAEHYNINKLRKVIEGGSSFGESLRNGVYAFEDYCDVDDVFMMHMAVAPLVPDDVISDLVRVCMKHGNAFSAEPSYKCMCEKTGDFFSDKYLDRELIYGLNTPQAIRYGKILDLYKQAERDLYDLNTHTHMSTLLLDMNERLYFSMSSPLNIKITTMEDVELFEAYIFMKEEKAKRGNIYVDQT